MLQDIIVLNPPLFKGFYNDNDLIASFIVNASKTILTLPEVDYSPSTYANLNFIPPIPTEISFENLNS